MISNHVIFILLFCISSISAQEIDSIIDARDGQVYNIIKIGSIWWMQDNLNYTSNDSWCYDDLSSNCEKYGRLCYWHSANNNCPNGWHLPTYSEYQEMYKAFGYTGAWGDTTIAYKLIDGGSSGFNIKLAGERSDWGYYRNLGKYGRLWCSSTSVILDSIYYNFVGIDRDSTHLDLIVGIGIPDIGFSVRCVRDKTSIGYNPNENHTANIYRKRTIFSEPILYNINGSTYNNHSSGIFIQYDINSLKKILIIR